MGKMYPHELSGGMKQRVCIAISIAMHPKVIIADEPTSALDVVTQRQVMQTIGRLQEEMGSAVILIGHDMGLMAQFVDRMAVMYAGSLVELGTVKDTFTEPLHPYTQMLIEQLAGAGQQGRLQGHPRHHAAAARPAARLRLQQSLPIGHGQSVREQVPALTGISAATIWRPATYTTLSWYRS